MRGWATQQRPGASETFAGVPRPRDRRVKSRFAAAGNYAHHGIRPLPLATIRIKRQCPDFTGRARCLQRTADGKSTVDWLAETASPTCQIRTSPVKQMPT